jgi:DNA-binding XRE family transcriptional regulator
VRIEVLTPRAAASPRRLRRGVAYNRLSKAIGRKSDNVSSRHLLRQYVSTLRKMLLASDSPYFVAVIKEVGYGLCEIVKSPSRTVSVGRTDGASEMGRTVRQLRIAAGLTQTALAKRSGMNRTHLSRLEKGRLMPTFPTLKRLAKTLQVTPRSLFRPAGRSFVDADAFATAEVR